VLIVTIDEKEYLHLGCLLEELFPESTIQMITDVINAKGVARLNQFSRVEEYIFIVEFGCSCPALSDDSMLDFEMTGNYQQKVGDSVPWSRMLRRGSNSNREHSENCFYPIFVNEKNESIDSVGYPPGKGMDKDKTKVPKGCIAI
jgi:adenine-specific DNA-methyltransferase